MDDLQIIRGLVAPGGFCLRETRHRSEAENSGSEQSSHRAA
jgi:hypothetical protein